MSGEQQETVSTLLSLLLNFMNFFKNLTSPLWNFRVKNRIQGT